MINDEFNDSELQGLVTRVRKLSDVKPTLQEMRSTNFDRYLEKQLQDQPIAARFAQAGDDWDLAIKGKSASVLAPLDQAEGLPLAEEQTDCGLKRP